MRANLYKMKLGYENFIKGKFFPGRKRKRHSYKFVIKVCKHWFFIKVEYLYPWKTFKIVQNLKISSFVLA
jgi:hypothetical protein